MDRLKDREHAEGHAGMTALYVDNIAVYSKTWEEHLATLAEVCTQAEVTT